MKKFLLSLGVLCFVFVGSVRAQLVADAGLDQSTCTGTFNFILNATATGGTPPYSYLWMWPGGGSDTTQNPVYGSTSIILGPNVFRLTITDNLGAQAFDSTIVTLLPAPSANAGPPQTLCFGDSLILGGTPTATGTTGPYTYSWAPNFGINSPQLANPVCYTTSPTTYSVTVTDVNGCTGSNTVFISVQNCGSTFSINSASPQCFGLCNGYAAVSPQGNYQYLWSNAATTRTITNLCAGTYSVTVSDSLANPLDILSVVITQPNPLFSNATANSVTCFGMSNGAGVITTTGGTPPYFYSWSNGITTPVAQNLSVGTYEVTVFDNNQCSATIAVTIAEPPALNFGALIVNPESVAGACDGSIVMTVSGGTAPYAYNWSNGANTGNLANLCAGTYTVTITDANGCSASAFGIVTAPCPNNTLVLTISSTGDIDCNRHLDTLTANASGGTPPYSFLWNNGATAMTNFVSTGGVYQAWVTDDSGCVKIAYDTVFDYSLQITQQTMIPVACNGVPNGKIKVAVSGGTPPYTFLWNNGATADSIEGVPAGTYWVVVTDAASCVDSMIFFLQQNSTNWSYYAYATVTPANCSNNGTATVTVYGGTSPFTYLWNTTPAQTTATATGLTAGYYNVTVTGNDGCTRTANAHVYTSCYNVVQGYLFNDANGNCIQDLGETPIQGVSVYATSGGASYYGYTNGNGFYSINVGTAGVFNLNASLYNGWGNCSNASVCPQSVTFTGLGDSTIANIGMGGGTGFDLDLHPGWHTANPGQVKDYWVLFGQNSQPYYTGPGSVVFYYDSILQYQSCTNGCVHNAANHSITWNFASMPTQWAPWNSRHMAYLLVPANTPLNYQLHADFIITPTSGDCRTSNNTLSVIEPITGSRDPNAKEVLPAGDIVEDDSVLTYTIHFQNTGNDTTWFIVLKDTLSPYLNPATVQNLASSHEYSSFEVSDNGILTWVFNPIYLVDSATNEPASKGFVSFKVKKKPNLPLTTEIKNTAHIYFDYNEAVVTNTVTNTVTLPNYIFTVKGDENISVSAMPNPFSKSTELVVNGINGTFDFELFDVTGKSIQKMASLSDTRFEIQRGDMSAGVYFYSITNSSKQRGFGKLVVE